MPQQTKQEILNHLTQDSIIKPVIQSTTLPRIQKGKDSFVALIKSITSQQLSVQVAASIFAKLNASFDQNIELKKIIDSDHEDLRSVGLSNQKANYVRNVALFFQEHDISDGFLKKMNDEEMIAYLTQIKGIGVWTVQMLLMFHFKRPDVFPIGDLSIRQKMVKLYHVKEEGKAQHAKLHKIAEQWRPHRSLACRYLWASKSV